MVACVACAAQGVAAADDVHALLSAVFRELQLSRGGAPPALRGGQQLSEAGRKVLALRGEQPVRVWLGVPPGRRRVLL